MRKLRFPIIAMLVFLHSSPITAQPVDIPGPPFTGLESSGFSRLTTHDELVAFLDDLDRRSRHLTVTRIGRSVQGRDLPMAMLSRKEFASERSEKPVVLIFAQQHGNEPSGKEAALILIRELAVGSLRYMLNHVDLLIVPSVNPDGGEAGQRRNANEQDLNRNHVVLSEPEVLAVHNAFLEWMPEVTLDVHEYNAISRNWIENGFIKDAAQMLDRVTHLNIDERILKISDETYIPEVGQKIQDDGFTFLRYTVGAPFRGQRIRHSTTNVNDGRQSLGIYNTFSFIFEGKRYGDLTNRIEKRTRAQLSALIAFVQTAISHRKEILETVHDARRKLVEGPHPEEAFIRLDYYPDPEKTTIDFPVFEFATWKPAVKALENYEPLVRVKKSVLRPFAYAFSLDEADLISLLQRHRIQMHLSKADVDAGIEAYTIKRVTPDTEEDKETEYVDATILRETRRIDAGTVLVFLDQPAGNLIPLLLEPESSYGICTRGGGRGFRFSEYLTPGTEFPVLRLMEEIVRNVEPL